MALTKIRALLIKYANGVPLSNTSSQLLAPADLVVRHIACSTGTPTAVLGPGAGTGTAPFPEVLISGTDLYGNITLVTGTAPTANAVLCTVTFNVAFANSGLIFLSPTNNAAAALGPATPFCTPSTSGFTLNSGAIPLTTNTIYIFNWIALGT